MEETKERSFSKYGTYTINESLELYFPGTEVKIEKVSDNVFSYFKKDVDDNIIEKKIPAKSSKLTIEVAPISPINYPAKRSSYVYLDFETPIFLPNNTSVTIFVQCPIEIGLFLLHDNHKDSLDWFTCDPFNSRFGLYGTPDSGTLCKYSKTPIVASYNDSLDYFNGIIKMELNNQLEEGNSITRIIFPIDETKIYYRDTKAIFDTINGTLKKKIILELLDINPKSIQTDWTPSPKYEKIEKAKRLSIGVD